MAHLSFREAQGAVVPQADFVVVGDVCEGPGEKLEGVEVVDPSGGRNRHQPPCFSPRWQ